MKMVKLLRLQRTFSVVYPEASVMISSPVAGDTYDHTYRHISGEFMGVGEVAVSLSVDGTAVDAMVDGNEFTYDLSDKLAEGEHTVSVSVEDENGETAQASTTFSVVYPEVSVMISSPLAANTYDHTYRHISGAFTGVGEVAVSLSVDGTAVEAMVDGNEFTFDLSDKLTEGEHTVSVSVEDENGETAQATTEFSVVYPEASVMISSPLAANTYDHTYRHISGAFTGVGEVAVSLSVDGTAVEAMVDGNEFTFDLSDKLTEGEHMVSVSVEDENGETAQASTTFSVVYPDASVSIDSPVAGGIYDHTYRHISGEFMGVGAVAVNIMIDGEAVDADSISVGGNEFTYMLSNKLTEGDHMVSVSVEDENGETAQATTEFSVVYPAASVMISSPVAGDTYDHTYRHISGEFTGVGEVTVNLRVDGIRVPARIDDNEFTYDLWNRLSEGEHMVSVSVTDQNGETAQASTTFSVVYPDASVSIDAPVAGNTYDHTYRHISGEFTGVGVVAVSLSVDGTAVEAMVDGNEFTYDLSDKLTEGEHTVSVSVTDENGETAKASTTFSVVYPAVSVMISSPVAGDTYDHTYRHISGEFMGVGAVDVNLTVDGTAVDAMVDGNEFTYDLPDKLTEGEHTVSVSVEDANDETAKASTTFSVVYPKASVTLLSPLGGHIFNHGKPQINGEFTGVGDVTVVLTVDGEVVKTEMVGESGFTAESPELAHGDHVILVQVTDSNGERAETGATFTVDIPGPAVAILSPASGQNDAHDDTVIRVEYSGTNVEVTTFTIDGNDVAVPDGNPFTYNAKDIGDGEHTVAVEVTDENGKTADATAIYNVVFPKASVTLLSPLGGHIFNHGKPQINGEFTGVGDVTVVLTVDGTTVATQKVGDSGFTAESPELAHGDHTISVEVTDANGEKAETGATFTVDIPGPNVAILSPASGQTYEHGEPVIRVEYTGTEVEVTTFTINGEDVEGIEPEDNAFEYIPTPALGDGEYKAVVVVTDENDKTAKASVVFNIAIPKDTTPPVISEVSPSGVLRLSAADVINEKYGVTIAAIITDEQSDIISIEYAINRNTALVPSGDEDYQAYPVDRADGKFEVSESFDLGTHQISLRVASEGGLREFRWHFTLEADTAAPTISSITPSGTIHAGMPTISASAADDSAVAEMTIIVTDNNGEQVAGETTDDGDDVRLNQGVTRIDFHPEAPLSEGTYSIEVRATDTYNNSSTANGVFTVDFDTAAPMITSYSPQNGARLMYKYNEVAKPTISITFGDAETGVNVDSIRLSLEGPGVDQVINLSDEQKSASQVVYTPDGLKEPGQYTVILEVSDNANLQGNVSEESDDAREANHTVHKFSFFVEYADAPVLMAPFNYPNPFADNTRISFGLNQMSVVSIVIYDSTLRPVRVLLDNKLMPAGKHTGGNGIGWDGKTSGGEKLARGIYYCQIVVTGSFESEYAILKLALTGAK